MAESNSPRSTASLNSNNEMSDVRAIAVYLPQYHPVPENDEWWGKGFTEWRNVTKARPLFPGHYQPHLPADLGFYDLRLPELREAQAALARQYGIHGFCHYHYWFNGRRILERPFNEVLASGKPEFPFCLCWANENWTRTWDGLDRQVLLEQRYSAEDDLAHIRSLLPAFADSRYIRIGNRPVFLVYRTELLPEPARTAEIWRNEVARAGLGELYLVRVENFVSGIDPASIGFDAAMEFAPDGVHVGALRYRGAAHRLLSKAKLLPEVYASGKVASYRAMMLGMLAKADPGFKRFRCVSPMWDNTARRGANARVYVGSTPELYAQWLEEISRQTIENSPPEEQIVFINAWNEWAEGCHLEPDLKWGHRYLEATASALRAAQSTRHRNVAAQPSRTHHWVKQAYWRAMGYLAEQRELLHQVTGRCG